MFVHMHAYHRIASFTQTKAENAGDEAQRKTLNTNEGEVEEN